MTGNYLLAGIVAGLAVLFIGNASRGSLDLEHIWIPAVSIVVGSIATALLSKRRGVQ